jgi:hypothetical protein
MSNFEKAYEIYIDKKGGQFAVHRAAEDGILKTDSWRYCDPCEIVSPIYKNSCLVCWEFLGEEASDEGGNVEKPDE